MDDAEWTGSGEGPWRLARGGAFAEVRRVDADRLAWWAEDGDVEAAGDSPTRRAAMDAAERALGIRRPSGTGPDRG